MGRIDATFNGHHLSAEGLVFNMSLGPTPDINTLMLIGEETTWPTGPLTLTDGETTVTITHLEPFAWRVRSGPEGVVTELQVRDSRHRWQTRGHITGEYNRPGADGEERDEKSVRALAALCLEALGEAAFDVDALPDDVYPYVRWEAAKPGLEAVRLCELCQCVLGLAADGTPRAYRLGQGIEIPAGWKTRNDLGRQSRDRADVYLVRGAQTMLERTSTLVPVGLDTDGVVREIEDLAYANAISQDFGSWMRGAVAGFLKWNAAPQGAAPDMRPAFECASKSVGRWFRLPSSDLKFLPALTTVCETVTQPAGYPARDRVGWKRPYLTSPDDTYEWSEAVQQFIAVTDVNKREWEFDEKAGLVKFARLAPFKRVPNPALWPECVSIRLTWAHRELTPEGVLTLDCFYTRSAAPNPPVNATVQVVEADWLQLRRRRHLSGATEDLNRAALDATADKLLALTDPGEAATDSAEVAYAGTKFIYPDGRVRRVTWSVGGGGATTTMTWNTERPTLGGARLERRIEALKRAHRLAEAEAVTRRHRLAGVAVGAEAAPVRNDRSGVGRAHFPGARAVVNLDSDAAPAYGIGYYAGDLDTPTGALRVRRAPVSGVSRLVIFCHAVPSGGLGWAWDGGVHPVRVAALPQTNRHEQVRYGAEGGQWTAVYDSLGPILMAGHIRGDLALPDANLILGDLGEDKAAPKVVARADGTVLGAFRTIIYAGERRVANPAPAHALVS